MIGDGTDGKVLCLECNKEFKGLSGHVAKAHVISLDEYRRRHTQDGTGNDVNVGWSIKTISAPGAPTKPIPDSKEEKRQAYDAQSNINANLSVAEREIFTRRYALLFKQADEDEALSTHIRDIVLGEINVDRFQDQISQITFRSTLDPKDVQRLDILTKLVKQLQETNLRTMKSLNLTREQKQKAGMVVESTPSRLITAYERFVAGLTPEQLSREKRDEEESVARLHAKAKEFRDLAPVEVTIE